ncbi:hypothetical protein R1flu_014583 [Riccia fluitans]|uniref:Uncharacterized protein n=1 Tax=Riccia fluitans TaxID=41844 RepID=A0ABD1YGM2_9MARC
MKKEFRKMELVNWKMRWDVSVLSTRARPCEKRDQRLVPGTPLARMRSETEVTEREQREGRPELRNLNLDDLAWYPWPAEWPAEWPADVAVGPVLYPFLFVLM